MIARMRYRLATRIESSCGETLVETLVAILVASLAMIMLANAIGIAKNIVGKGRDAANEHYEAETALATTEGTPETMKVTLTSVNKTDVTGTDEPVNVTWRELEVPGGYTVVSYEPV